MKKIKAINVRPARGDASAWCTVCNWQKLGMDVLAATVCAAARKHTVETGHETRIDINKQRGYRVRQ